jgi:hypothetical protein
MIPYDFSLSPAIAEVGHVSLNSEETFASAERRMRRRFEVLSEIVFETDASGKITFLNRAWSRILGHEMDGSLTLPMRDFVAAADRPVLQAAIAGPTASLGAELPRLRMLRVDGSERWMELAAMPLEEGGAVGALRCVSPIQVAQAEFEKLALVASHTCYPVIVADGRGRIEWVNEAFVRKTGYSFEEALGRTPGSILQCPGTDSETVESIRRRLLEGRPFQVEILNRTKSGEEFWASIQISPVRNERGEVERFVSVSTDVTEVRLARAELDAKKEAAESANAAKTRFLCAISDEMRTPLNAILGTAEMALESAGTARDRHYFTRIDENAEVLVRLASDLLDVFKIESGQFEWEPVQFHLPDCLRQVLVPVAERAERKGLSFELNLDTRLPRQILGDPARLRQIVEGVAGNAVKFTARGFVRVDAAAVQDPETGTAHLEIRVADSGPGIPAAELPRIFEPFFQGEDPATRRKGGAGLGLSIVKSLVTAAGGTVCVQSSSGNGTEFRISIPLAAPVSFLGVEQNAAKYRIVGRVASREPSFGVDLGRPRFQPLAGLGRSITVLVSEDHDDNFAIVHRHLTNAGYSVDRAVNGREAVSAVRVKRYDVILMDVEMPEMDGLEATRAIRALEKLASRPPVPILAVTAHAVTGYRSICLESGCNNYLAKPVRKQSLLDAVVEALEESRHA